MSDMKDSKKNTDINETENTSGNFIYNIIEKDLENRVYGNDVYTRFPPEPNGYLHIGHAKSICLNFSTAKKYGGKCNLRYNRRSRAWWCWARSPSTCSTRRGPGPPAEAGAAECEASLDGGRLFIGR